MYEHRLMLIAVYVCLNCQVWCSCSSCVLISLYVEILNHSYVSLVLAVLGIHKLLFFSQTHIMLQPEANFYCGLCNIDCGGTHRQEGCRWQKYGDWRIGEVFWIYLCKGCRKFLWRLYSKFEFDEQAEQDPETFYKMFGVFLRDEIHKSQYR